METRPTIASVQSLLKFTYGLVPIVAGADKFTEKLTDWDQYLNPAIARMLPFDPHTFMLIVGAIEIIAGIIVFVRPALGGMIVWAWLNAIALSLIAGGMYLDIAVRDLVMAIGAYSLARISRTLENPRG